MESVEKLQTSKEEERHQHDKVVDKILKKIHNPTVKVLKEWLEKCCTMTSETANQVIAKLQSICGYGDDKIYD